MTISKETFKRFLIEKFGSIDEKRALFEREVNTLLKEFQKWYRDNNWGKNLSGVNKKLIRKWLLQNNCFFVSKRR